MRNIIFQPNNSLKHLPAILLATVILSGCIKNDYDNPSPSTGDPAVSGTKISVDSLLGWFAPNGAVEITADVYIETIVAADDKSGNFFKEIILQDHTGGIAVVLDRSDYHSEYPLGRKVFVKCRGLWIGDYNGLIQLGAFVEPDGTLGRIPSLLVRDFLIKGSYYHPVDAVTLRPGDLAFSNYRSYLNRLVVIDSAEFAVPDTTYANGFLQIDRNLTVNTCQAGSIVLRTSGFSEFANTNVPDGNGRVYAILQIFDSNGLWDLADMQIKIRNTSDVIFTGPRCGAAPPGGFTILSETFDGVSDNTDIALSGWLNLAIQGNRYWRGGSFSGNSFGQATAFGSSLPAMETWLITPELNLASADTLSFISAQAFWAHDGLAVFISTDFDGTAGGFAGATWTPLSPTLAGQANNNYDWVPSGNVPLTMFSGSGYIGFRYTGDGTNNTTTYRVDDVSVY